MNPEQKNDKDKKKGNKTENNTKTNDAV